jgi:hypothetical protein
MTSGAEGPNRDRDEAGPWAGSTHRDWPEPVARTQPSGTGTPPRPPAHWSSALTPVLAVGLACLIGAAFFIANTGSGTPAASPTSSTGLIAAGVSTEPPTLLPPTLLPPTPGPTPTGCDFTRTPSWSDTTGTTATPATSLNACQTLYLTSGTISVDGKQACGGVGEQICVLTYTVTAPHQVASGDAVGDTGHTYWAVADGSPSEMVEFHRTDFFDPKVGNCVTGCSYATVVPYLDGKPQPSYRVVP